MNTKPARSGPFWDASLIDSGDATIASATAIARVIPLTQAKTAV